MKKLKTKRNSFDIMISIFAWLSFFVAIFFAVMVILSTVAGAENGKTVFGHKLLIVESDSMSKSPISEDEKIFFSSGDIIIVEPTVDVSIIQEGDVITFVSSNPDSVGKTLTHKVRSVKKSDGGALLGFETYGINTGISDKAVVDPTTVIGKYDGKIENLGTLFMFFKTPAGYFLGLLIPCLLLLIFFSVAVGKLLGRKEMADSFDVELDRLKGRVDQLENMEDTAVVQTATEEPPLDVSHEKYFDLTINTLTHTIETLAATIESLATTVEKPIETLTRTVENLAKSNVQADVSEPTKICSEDQEEIAPEAVKALVPLNQPTDKEAPVKNKVKTKPTVCKMVDPAKCKKCLHNRKKRSGIISVVVPLFAHHTKKGHTKKLTNKAVSAKARSKR